MIERDMKSFKSALACVAGFVLGGAFGVFTAGIDTNVGFDPKDPLRTPTAREVLKDMGQRGVSYAKNFALVGAMFSCTECITESHRGKCDWKNTVYSGCVTGGAIGFCAGLKAGVLGYGGFAAFSANIICNEPLKSGSVDKNLIIANEPVKTHTVRNPTCTWRIAANPKLMYLVEQFPVQSC